MAKDENKKSVEDEVFEEFGITDDDQKAAVKVHAAARALAARKGKSKPEEKPPNNRWLK